MNFREQLHKARYGPICNRGGDSKSTSNTTSNTTTTSVQTNTDNSMMLGDSALGFTGSNNLIDKSSAVNTQMFDSSDRSTNFTDNSNRSTNFTDNSIRDSSTSTSFSDHSVNTVTDYGSVGLAMSQMGSYSNLALNQSGVMAKQAIDGLLAKNDQNNKVIGMAFDFARGSGANALTSAQDVMGYAASSVDKAKAAFQEAASTPENKTVKMLAIAGVCIAGFIYLKGQ